MYGEYINTDNYNAAQVFTSNKTTPLNASNLNGMATPVTVNDLDSLGTPITIDQGINTAGIAINNGYGVITTNKSISNDYDYKSSICLDDINGWKELDNHVETHEFISKDNKFYKILKGNYHFDMFEKIIINGILFIIINKYFEIEEDRYTYIISSTKSEISHSKINQCKINKSKYDFFDFGFFLNKTIKRLIETSKSIDVDYHVLIHDNKEDKSYYSLEFNNKRSIVKKIECFESIKLNKNIMDLNNTNMLLKRKEENITEICFDFDDYGIENILDRKKAIASKLHHKFCTSTYCTWNDELMECGIWENMNSEHYFWLRKVELLHNEFNIKLKDIETIYETLNF